MIVAGKQGDAPISVDESPSPQIGGLWRNSPRSGCPSTQAADVGVEESRQTKIK